MESIAEAMAGVKLETEKPKWHQQFRLTLTKFELEVILHIRCSTWREGSRFLRSHKLNSCLTTRCKDEAEARDQLAEKLSKWYNDEALTSVQAPGQLLYWKVYDAEAVSDH